MLINIIAHFIGVGVGLAGYRLIFGKKKLLDFAVGLIPFELGFLYGVFITFNLE